MKINKIPLLIAILFLLIAAFSHPAHRYRYENVEGLPYVFYQILRFLDLWRSWIFFLSLLRE